MAESDANLNTLGFTLSVEPTQHHKAVSRAFHHLIKIKGEEAMYAIFGHWGRGKSFIASQISEYLADTHDTVKFSSWRYPNIPECWVFLYETMLVTIKEKGLIKYAAFLLSFNLSKYGPWPIILTHIAAIFSSIILGVFAKIDFLVWATSTFGLTVMLLGFRAWEQPGRDSEAS